LRSCSSSCSCTHDPRPTNEMHTPPTHPGRALTRVRSQKRYRHRAQRSEANPPRLDISSSSRLHAGVTRDDAKTVLFTAWLHIPMRCDVRAPTSRNLIGVGDRYQAARKGFAMDVGERLVPYLLRPRRHATCSYARRHRPGSASSSGVCRYARSIRPLTPHRLAPRTAHSPPTRRAC
jgi:hypothetical protein